MKKSWYSIKAQGDDSADVDIFDEIGHWGIRAQDFLADLKHVGAVKNIRVRINSYGGEVFDGIAIYNILKRHQAKVTVEIYGIAASIASIIAMAGDRVIMPANTWMFIHDPLALAIGDADDMRELADELDKIAASLVTTYMGKTGKTEKEVVKWMADDSWFSAAEALAAGLADEVTDEVSIAAKLDVSRFKNIPKALQPTAPTPDDARRESREIVDLCAKAGVADAALGFLDKGLTVDEVKARFGDAEAIRTACVLAKLPNRAANYVKAGMTLAEVRAELFDIMAANDPKIDNTLPVNDKPKPAPAGDQRQCNLRSPAQLETEKIM